MSDRATNCDYDVMNAVLRGIVSANGGGGGITGLVISVPVELTFASYEALLANVVRALRDIIQDGDIVVVTSSVIALAQGRIVPFDSIPKKTGVRNEIPALMTMAALEDCAKRITDRYQLPCTVKDVLLSDSFVRDGETVLLLAPQRPNDVAFDLATEVRKELAVACDVVIKDSDAGTLAGAIVIGQPTLVATPLGATKGLSIIESMRVAAAAEARMGKKNRIPIVVCRPANAVVRDRLGIGQRRADAFLDATREPLLSSHDERR
jgi:F420-0:gamma-glutamyl ligase